MYKITVVGWLIFFLVIYAISKTKAGFNLIYYSLILVLVLLFVGQYKSIQNVMLKQVEQ